jgi:hypothetical protein
MATYTMQQSPQEGQPQKKDPLSSRLIERAFEYSWIRLGWNAASLSYDLVKNSTKLTQYGCQLVENNVSRVAHSKVTEGTVQFLAPFIVAVDEFGVRQLDKFETGVEFTQRAMSKLVIQPASSAYQAVTSLPSRLLDNAEALVDHYLPEERKGDERPSAGNKKTHQHAQEISRSSFSRTFRLISTTAKRVQERLDYERLRAQATETLQSYETLHDIITYLKTNDPAIKKKLINNGQKTYWHIRRNYKDIFIHAARAVVQPLLVQPFMKLYSRACSFESTIKRVLLRGPFAVPTESTSSSS